MVSDELSLSIGFDRCGSTQLELFYKKNVGEGTNVGKGKSQAFCVFSEKYTNAFSV